MITFQEKQFLGKWIAFFQLSQLHTMFKYPLNFSTCKIQLCNSYYYDLTQ